MLGREVKRGMCFCSSISKFSIFSPVAFFVFLLLPGKGEKGAIKVCASFFGLLCGHPQCMQRQLQLFVESVRFVDLSEAMVGVVTFVSCGLLLLQGIPFVCFVCWFASREEGLRAKRGKGSDVAFCCCYEWCVRCRCAEDEAMGYIAHSVHTAVGYHGWRGSPCDRCDLGTRGNVKSVCRLRSPPKGLLPLYCCVVFFSMIFIVTCRCLRWRRACPFVILLIVFVFIYTGIVF